MQSKIDIAYNSHKGHSKIRKIPFNFTKTEWILWWETNLGFDWHQLRGTKRGQYVMARIGDTGPYAEWNVKCILNTENTKECKTSGRKSYRLSAKEVVKIYYDASAHKEIATRYAISLRMVRLIKNKQVWKSVVSNL